MLFIKKIKPKEQNFLAERKKGNKRRKKTSAKLYSLS